MSVSQSKVLSALLFALIGVASTAMPFAAAAGRPVETDRDKLQGQWQIVSIAIEGTVIRKDSAPLGWKETFKDLLIEGDRLGQDRPNKGKFTLDERRQPKQITIQPLEGTGSFRGIYDLNGDTLKVCMNGNGADVCRPEEFVSKKGSPLIVLTLKKRHGAN